jgi:hypothetical protein
MLLRYGTLLFIVMLLFGCGSGGGGSSSSGGGSAESTTGEIQIMSTNYCSVNISLDGGSTTTIRAPTPSEGRGPWAWQTYTDVSPGNHVVSFSSTCSFSGTTSCTVNVSAGQTSLIQLGNIGYEPVVVDCP